MKIPNVYLKLLLILFLFSYGCGQVAERKLVGPSTANRSVEKQPSAEPVEPPQTNTANPESTTNDKTSIEPSMDNSAELSKSSSFDLMANIQQSVDSLTGTPYSRELGNDCSGIFLQVLDGMRDQAPNAIFPTKRNARTSRAIAVWYAKHGDFKIVRNPKTQGDLIKPGMVMFYGYANRDSLYNYKTITLDTLKTRGIGINHIAVVMEVNRDKNNVVQSYTIFHGRNVGKNAGTTTSCRTYPFHPELPVYGNWGEPWLAIAEIVTPKK